MLVTFYEIKRSRLCNGCILLAKMYFWITFCKQNVPKMSFCVRSKCWHQCFTFYLHFAYILLRKMFSKMFSFAFCKKNAMFFASKKQSNTIVQRAHKKPKVLILCNKMSKNRKWILHAFYEQKCLFARKMYIICHDAYCIIVAGYVFIT